MFKVLHHHCAEAEQQMWIPAFFAIPWMLGQQVRHKKQQIRQTKETGRQLKKFS